jgi:hypothetical protein
MKQAFHIFKKDVRYLRYEIAMTLLAATAFIFTGLRHAIMASNAIPNQGIAWSALLIFLPITWWFLISRVVQAESPTSRKQFWLTRPYEWKSLLGAKVLFIALFVNIPLLVADVVIIQAFGFSPVREIAGLVWTQVLFTLACVLPAAALSSIARGIGSLITAILLGALGLLAYLIFAPWLHTGSSWFELEWVREYYVLLVVGAAALTIILWQYSGRKTAASRALAVIAALAIWTGFSFLPWTTAFALQTQLSERRIDPSVIHIGLDLDRKWLGRVYSNVENQMVIDLPLQITGVPAGTELKANGLTAVLLAPDGQVGHCQDSPPAGIDSEAGVISLQATASNEFYAKVKDLPIRLRGTLFFTLFGNKQATDIPLEKRTVPVPGVGECAAGAHFFLCNSAFRDLSNLVSVRTFQISATRSRLPRRASYSPFPADLRIDPIDQFFAPQFGSVSAIVVETVRPLAYLRRDFEIDNVRLGDFEMQRLSKTSPK